MRQSMRVVTLVLIALLCFTIAVFAVDDQPGNGGGGGTGLGGANGTYTWKQEQSGYRFCVVDNNFNQISNTVDILYSTPAKNFGADYYTNTRTTAALSTSVSNYARITFNELVKLGNLPSNGLPLPPITLDGGSSSAHGEEFKEWFLGGVGHIYNPSNPNANPSSPTPNPTYNPSNPNPNPTRGVGNDDKTKIRQDDYYGRDLDKEKPSPTIIDYWRAGNYAVAHYGISESELAGKYNGIADSIVKLYSKYGYTMYSFQEFAWHLVKSTDDRPAVRAYLYLKIAALKGSASSQYLIPMAGGAGQTGYAYQIMNTKIDGKLLFQVQGNTTDDVIAYITDNNYNILVEPIFWFRPAKYVDKTITGLHTNYIYGTVSNHVKFYEKHGYKFGASGGTYTLISTRLGHKCMLTKNDWAPQGHILMNNYAAGESADRITLSQFNGYINGSVGAGLHLYTSAPQIMQTTYDEAKGSTPAPAPDPSVLVIPDEITPNVKIVKYYERETTVNGSTTRTPVGWHTRDSNPPTILIEREPEYIVEDYFISTATTNTNGQAYYTAKSSLNVTRSGGGETTVQLDNETAGERSLHVLLVNSGGTPSVSAKTDLTLSESELSRRISTGNPNIPNWGVKPFNFTYGAHNMVCSTPHKVDETSGGYVDENGNGKQDSGEEWWGGSDIKKPCTPVMGDIDYKYVIASENTADGRVEAVNKGDSFSQKLHDNVLIGKAVSSGGTEPFNTAYCDTVIWRGYDIPTLASFKSNANTAKQLIPENANTPNGRSGNGEATKDITLRLYVDDLASDTVTTSRHNMSNQYGTHTSTISTVNHTPEFHEIKYEGDVKIQTYKGSPSQKTQGNTFVSGIIQTISNILGNNTDHSQGVMVSTGNPLGFYPYIRMSYQDVNGTKRNALILSEFQSSILPNDFAEASWYNAQEDESLVLASPQWSMHAGAVQGSEPWNGANQVLPGGALYNIATAPNETQVMVTTWQTVLDGTMSGLMSGNVSEYTEAKAQAHHEVYADEASEVLDNILIKQWVNADYNASTAWENNGKSLKADSSVSLDPLGLPGNASEDSKYYLRDDKMGASPANEGDLDIIGRRELANLYYKVFADTSGNIYLARSNNMNALSGLNGTNPGSAQRILTKGQSAGSLSGEAKELDTRTKLITNIVQCLERNTGNDPSASWASDGRWYNEAFDGIYVMKQATVFTVGFKDVTPRLSVLDPKLTPINTGKADLFSTAFLSQFKANNYSEIAIGKPDTYLATFKGKQVLLEDMDLMYVSKKFYLPNVTVQDLGAN